MAINGTFAHVYHLTVDSKGKYIVGASFASNADVNETAKDSPTDDVNRLSPNETFTTDKTAGTTFTYVGTATVNQGGGTVIGFIGKVGNDLYLFTDTANSGSAFNTLTQANGKGGDGTTVICFLPGTRIATPQGEVSVESLKAGDLVQTAEKRTVPVRWVGRQTISTLFADPLRVLPICIKAGALAENVPSRDLYVSPDHAILIDDILVHASALVNGSSIVRAPAPAKTFTYYHVELADHSLLLADNVPAESFIDNVDRLAFDNWDEHEGLGDGTAPLVEMAYPRAKAARQVPMAIRERLAARGQSLFSAVAPKAA
jgi:Hint domain